MPPTTRQQPKASSRCELCSMLASRIYFSKLYIVFYLFMILLNVVSISIILTSYKMYSYKISPGLIVLEIIINLLLVLEISIRFLSQGENFWKSWWNTLDMLITILCLFSVFALIILPAEDEIEEVFATTLVGLRYIMQGLRIVLLIRAGRASQIRHTFDVTEIEFSTIQQHGFDEENISNKLHNNGESKNIVTRNRSASQIGLMNINPRGIGDSMDSFDDEYDDDQLPLGTFDLSRLKSAISISMSNDGEDDDDDDDDDDKKEEIEEKEEEEINYEPKHDGNNDNEKQEKVVNETATKNIS